MARSGVGVVFLLLAAACAPGDSVCADGAESGGESSADGSPLPDQATDGGACRPPQVEPGYDDLVEVDEECRDTCPDAAVDLCPSWSCYSKCEGDYRRGLAALVYDQSPCAGLEYRTFQEACFAGCEAAFSGCLTLFETCDQEAVDGCLVAHTTCNENCLEEASVVAARYE